MHRSLLFLVLLFVAVQLSHQQRQFNLMVDPVGGTDVTDCRDVPAVDNAISPTIACKTISYALGGPATQSDFMDLQLFAGGVLSGAGNTNIKINFESFVLYSPNASAAVIDCGGSAKGLEVTLSFTSSIDNIEFRNCVSPTFGGAITITPTSRSFLDITDCRFIGNKATQGHGGAIYTSAAANNLQISGCTFTENSAGDQNGGAIYVMRQNIRVSNNIFRFNSAAQGGAIYGKDLPAPLQQFTSNTFINNTAGTQGGAFFADNTGAATSVTYSFTDSSFENNCALSEYTNSTEVQVRCSGMCTIDKGNFTGCTDIQQNIPDASDDGGGKGNKDRAIIIGVVVPFGILAILSIVLFLYIRKRHNAEMEKRDEYRKKILKALENLPPEEQEAARLEAENADPNAPKCQLCQVRPISAPLPCGHEIVCGVCRTILLECPMKGCKRPTR